MKIVPPSVAPNVSDTIAASSNSSSELAMTVTSPPASPLTSIKLDGKILTSPSAENPSRPVKRPTSPGEPTLTSVTPPLGASITLFEKNSPPVSSMSPPTSESS